MEKSNKIIVKGTKITILAQNEVDFYQSYGYDSGL